MSDIILAILLVWNSILTILLTICLCIIYKVNENLWLPKVKIDKDGIWFGKQGNGWSTCKLIIKWKFWK
jgi:hypothetical protein